MLSRDTDGRLGHAGRSDQGLTHEDRVVLMPPWRYYWWEEGSRALGLWGVLLSQDTRDRTIWGILRQDERLGVWLEEAQAAWPPEAWVIVNW